MALREAVVEAACSQRDRVEPMLLVLSVMGVLLLISLLFLDPQENPASYNIALIDLGLLVFLFVGLGGLFYFCTSREMD